MAEENIQEVARVHVARLVEGWDWPDPAILADIVALGEAAIPAIQDALTPELLADTFVDDQAGATVLYLAEVLGSIGSVQAIPLVVNLFRHIDEDTIEFLPDIMHALGPDSIEPLVSVVADKTLRWFPRAIAAQAALTVAGADIVLQERVSAGLRDILASCLARTDPLSDEERETLGSIVADHSYLADPKARPLIEMAFDADIVNHRPKDEQSFDIPIISRKDVQKLYDEGGSPTQAPPRRFLERYHDDLRRHFEEEEKRRKTKALLHVLEDAETETVVLGPRLGRNDPCWCGSGNKYKKCHLADDEKLGL